MKKLPLKIPEDSAVWAISLIKNPGIAVKEKDTKAAREKMALVSPTFLFGKWKNINLDAKELRKKAWDRATKF